MSSYGMTREVDMDYEAAVDEAKEGLEEHGFGVLSEIDVSATLEEKLGVEFDDYVILGACNPENAYEGLQEEKELGLLLPCNVIVYRDNNRTYVSAVKATEALGITENDELNTVAEEVENNLKNFIDDLDNP